MYGDDEYLREAYQQIVDKQKTLVNEGLFDRTKAAVSGIGQSIKNAPKVAGNVIKGAVAGAKGDVNTVKQAAQSNEYRINGEDQRRTKLIAIHTEKAKKLVDEFHAKFKTLAADYESDTKKAGIFKPETQTELREQYLDGMAQLLEPMLAEIKGEGQPIQGQAEQGNDPFDTGEENGTPAPAAAAV